MKKKDTNIKETKISKIKEKAQDFYSKAKPAITLISTTNQLCDLSQKLENKEFDNILKSQAEDYIVEQIKNPYGSIMDNLVSSGNPVTSGAIASIAEGIISFIGMFFKKR